jgi:hypothetical protein
MLLVLSASVGAHEGCAKRDTVDEVLCGRPLASKASVVVTDYLTRHNVAQHELVAIGTNAPVAGITAGRFTAHAASLPVSMWRTSSADATSKTSGGSSSTT